MACLASSVFAQDFVYSYDEKELKNISTSIYIDEHPFGPDIANKLWLLKDSYTYSFENNLSGTTVTQTEKASIYNSVKKSNSYLVKAVRKGLISKEEATLKLDDIIVKVLNIRYQDTEMLETKLWETKEPEQILALYSESVILEM
ncbi:MAG: hypothetical protein OCD76_02850 [Reichenbachiella sp.]